MKRIIYVLMCVMMYVVGSNAQTAQFRLTFNGSTIFVNAVFGWTDASSCFNGGDVVLIFPSATPIGMITPGAGWSWTGGLVVPLDGLGLAGHSVQSFNSASIVQNVNAVTGADHLLFSFALPPGCTAGQIRLMEYNGTTCASTDPDMALCNFGILHTLGTSTVGNCNPSGSGFAGLANPILVIDCALLPVEFLSFNARKSGATALLEWATVSEVYNEYFAVQRSINGSSFETIGKVPGAGHSSQIQNYQFIDKTPVRGKNYYRILQVDSDGQSSPTGIRIVNFERTSTGVELLVHPNPATDGVHVYLSGDESITLSADLVLIDNLGRTVFTRSIEQNSSYEFIDFTKVNIGAGVYVLQLVDDDRVIDIEKIVIQR